MNRKTTGTFFTTDSQQQKITHVVKRKTCSNKNQNTAVKYCFMHNVPLKSLGICVGDLFGFLVGNLYDKMTIQVKSTHRRVF